MQIFSIPVEDNRFILYRPLLRRAFIGNQSMADLVAACATQSSPATNACTHDAIAFLQDIDFLKPDPPPMPLPDLAYHPSMAVLLLTNRCNLRCTYCYADGGMRPVQDMALEVVYTAIDYVYQTAKAMHRPHFDVTFHGGGEPMQMWDKLQTAVTYARAKDLPSRIAMVTNGVWTRPQRAWILENFDGLSVSFDGRPTTQNQQRPLWNGQGSFRAVMRTLKALDRAKLSYGIRMTATAPWREKLPEDVRFICEHTACQTMQVEPAYNTARGTHRFPTSDEGLAFADAFMEAFAIAAQAGRRLTYSGARPWLLTRTFCSAPYNALIVTPTGDLVTCYEIASDDHELAGLSTIGHIAGSHVVIDHEARQALLERLHAKREACEGCFLLWHCAGDCYTRTFDKEAGTFATPSPRCPVNREITKRLLLWYIMAGGGVWQGQAMPGRYNAQICREP